jgi:hypothetical protein
MNSSSAAEETPRDSGVLLGRLGLWPRTPYGQYPIAIQNESSWRRTFITLFPWQAKKLGTPSAGVSGDRGSVTTVAGFWKWLGG